MEKHNFSVNYILKEHAIAYASAAFLAGIAATILVLKAFHII